jgi:acetyltransferase-like isoleucine patch superfamily enzyme
MVQLESSETAGKTTGTLAQRMERRVRAILKSLANGLATLIVLPTLWLYGLLSLISDRQALFSGWSQGFSLIPGTTGAYLRRAFYRCVLPRLEADVWISFGTTISHPTTEFGRSVYVGPYGMLGDVTLEDDVLLGSNVSIMNGSEQHGIGRLDIPIREQPGKWPRVTVGRDSWIGDRSIVMADVGKHCVIGAGAVVTKPIPDYAIAVGAPAKVVRDRRQNHASDTDGEFAATRTETPVLEPHSAESQ